MRVIEVRFCTICEICGHINKTGIYYINTKIESLYTHYLRRYESRCPKCNRGQQRLFFISCKVVKENLNVKRKCVLTWQCLSCGQKWITSTKLTRKQFRKHNTENELKVTTCCPNPKCTTKDIDNFMLSWFSFRNS